MKETHSKFNDLVEHIYRLSLEDKEELKSLLEHNISDARRKEILANYKSALKEQAAGKTKFSSSVRELKKML